MGSRRGFPVSQNSLSNQEPQIVGRPLLRPLGEAATPKHSHLYLQIFRALGSDIADSQIKNW